MPTGFWSGNLQERGYTEGLDHDDDDDNNNNNIY